MKAARLPCANACWPTRPFSIAAGGYYEPQPRMKLGLNLSRTGRAPSAEELFANGPHAGTQAFEIGDPGLVKDGVEAHLQELLAERAAALAEEARQEFVVGGFRPSVRAVDALLVGYYEGGRLDRVEPGRHLDEPVIPAGRLLGRAGARGRAAPGNPRSAASSHP